MKLSDKIFWLFGLFVIGFFLLIFSLSLQNWNRSRSDFKKEVQIVAHIAEDVALYKFHHEYGTKRMEEVITSAESLLNMMRNSGQSVDEEEIELNLHKLTWLWLSATPTTAYVTLTNSGEISYISSITLRSKLKELNMEQEKLLQFEEMQVRYVDQHLRPFLNKNMDRTAIDTYQRADSLITVKNPSAFKNTSSDLLNSREFANILTDLVFYTKRIMLPYRRMEVVLKDLEEIIAQEHPFVRLKNYEPF